MRREVLVYSAESIFTVINSHLFGGELPFCFSSGNLNQKSDSTLVMTHWMSGTGKFPSITEGGMKGPVFL